MRRFVSFVLLLALASNAGAFEPTGNQWEDGTATLLVGLSGISPSGDSWQQALTRAMNAWSQATSFSFAVNVSSADPCVSRGSGMFGDGNSAVDFAASQCGTEFGQNVLAVTLSTLTCANRFCTGAANITEADIVFNDSLNWDVYSGPIRFGAQDFERVALHELGHVLGLGHESSQSAIMQASVTDLSSLQEDDINGANFIYGGEVTTPSVYGFDIVLPTATSFSDPFSTLEISSDLGTADILLDGRFLDVYQLTFANDSSIDIQLDSSEFNPMLFFVRVASTQSFVGGSELIDDNSGTGLNARILTNVTAGTYWLGVSSGGFAETGNYDINLFVNRLTEARTFETFESIYGATVEINPNPHIDGTLADSDFSYENRRLDLYQFQVDQFTDLQIDLSSNDFDTTLLLVEIGEDQQPGTLFLEDDDGGNGLNSRIVTGLAPGTYWLGVTSFGAGETGDYDIEVAVVLP